MRGDPARRFHPRLHRIRIPILLALEVIASAHLLPQAWFSVQWSSVGWLTISAWVATPLGVALLAKTPTTAMQAAISAVVL